MKFFSFILLFALSPMLDSEVFSQEPLQVFGEQKEDGLLIYWKVKDPDHWAKLVSIGYQVERENLSNGKKEVMSKKVIPNERNWFAGEDGFSIPFIEMLGWLVHDSPLYSYQGKMLSAANELRYNYLFQEIQNDAELAIALGVGVKDANAASNHTYKYSVKSLDQKLSGSITVNPNGDEEKLSNQYFDIPRNEPVFDWAETWQESKIPEVNSSGSGNGDKIVIKWVTGDAKLWKEGISKGFRVEREDMNGKKKVIGNIKAKSATESVTNQDPYVHLAKAMLYPESPFKEEMVDVLRYKFCLFAAEKSSKASEFLGWGYEDTDVEKEMFYTYFIQPPKDPVLEIDNTSMVSVQNSDAFKDNLASGQVATASSTASSSIANMVIDGNTNGDFEGGSVLMTETEAGAWVTVDLGGHEWIESLRIFNRTDCCMEGLEKYYLLIGNNPFPENLDVKTARANASWSSDLRNDSDKEIIEISIPPNTKGRFVRLQLAEDAKYALNIAEIEILGRRAN